MSTKSTIWYGDSVHIYNECFDDESTTYIDIKHKGEFGDTHTTIGLPLAAALAIARSAIQDRDHLQSLADMTDEDIRERCIDDVTERIEAYEQAQGKPPGHPQHFVALAGGFAYGLPSDPKQKQLDEGHAYWREARSNARRLLTEKPTTNERSK